MTSMLKITSSQLIAREVPSKLSEASSMPRRVVHVPGVMNVLSDALSRMIVTRSQDLVLTQLLSVPRAVPARQRWNARVWIRRGFVMKFSHVSDSRVVIQFL